MAMSKKNAKSQEELLKEALVPLEEQPYEIPVNWVWVNIGAVTTFVGSGVTPRGGQETYLTEGVPFIRSQNVLRNKLFLEHVSYISRNVHESMKRTHLHGKETLFNITGASIGRAALFTSKVGPANVNQHVCILRFKDEIHPSFPQYWLNSSLLQKILMKIQVGVTRQGLNYNQVRALPIPVPPYNEQKRIIQLIEGYIMKINQAKQLIEEAKATFELRRAAILDKAFRGELTRKWREDNSNQTRTVSSISKGINQDEIPFLLPTGWQWARLRDLGTLERGRSKHRPRNDPKLFGGEYPFIQTGEVANARDYISSYKQTLSEYGLQQSKLFPEGTVCITIAANIADTALLKFPCCFPDSVVGFIPKDAFISSLYLHYYMRTIKSNLEHYAPATAQKNINLKVLQEIVVPVPPKSEHDEILHMIDSLMQKDEKAQTIMTVASDLEILEQSVLSKAFRGKLGTNETSENLIYTE